MKKLLIASVATLSLVGISAWADDSNDQADDNTKAPKTSVAGKDVQLYVNASLALNQFSITEDNVDYVSDMMGAGYVRAGVSLAKYFGVEAEYGLGFSDYEEGNLSWGMDNQLAGFIVGRLPTANNKADMFLRVGYHSTDLTIGFQDFNPQTGQFETVMGEYSDEGLAGGIGGNYYFNENLGIRADISSYRLDEDFILIGGQLGLVARF